MVVDIANGKVGMGENGRFVYRDERLKRERERKGRGGRGERDRKRRRVKGDTSERDQNPGSFSIRSLVPVWCSFVLIQLIRVH